MMRRIAARNGGDTDTSRDHEYTGWVRLRGQVAAFLEPLNPAEAAEHARAVSTG
jgi:menaquinone-dependent protoporphyrinogen IX oxidase